MMQETGATIEQRLAQLERRNRVLQRGLVISLLAPALMLASQVLPARTADAQATRTIVAEVVAAQQFEVRDQQGDIQAWLGVDRDTGRPALSFYGLSGRRPGEGRTGVSLVALDDTRIMLLFHTPEGQALDMLGINRDGEGYLRIYDRDGNVVWSMGASPER